ncbi:unnamed protein product [Lactuca saligna]|uniref:CCR4-Not complex component Not N-terminal domain-containing protein n=1 Tax=Lactuca saligna TaxID=75948 RepID=A0AA35YET8_LACSI|nr:unnamed protein product [Lactuca saligna]
MGASRNLQGEMERVLKIVQEGVDVFDSIGNLINDADIVNEKEKFEADMKKEIKKLREFRHRLKTSVDTVLRDQGYRLEGGKLLRITGKGSASCEKTSGDAI